MTDLAVVERVSEFRKKAREAFLTFEHKEGSRLVHDKYVSGRLKLEQRLCQYVSD